MLKRLLGIVYILINKRTVTASELAERFEVSVRTIYRDVEALSMAGIPVYTQRGKAGGICLMEQFVLDKMLVTEEEQQQIVTALSSVEQTVGGDKSETLDKVRDFFQIESQNWLSIDFSDWSEQRHGLFALLKQAVLTHEVLIFDYYGRNGDMKNRTVEPLQLIFKDYTWYVKAYCRERRAMRLFKVIRMKRVRGSGERFVPDTKKYEEQFQSDEFSSVPMMLEQVVLHIDKTQAYRVYDRFEEDEIDVQEDGSFLVHTECPQDDWIYEVIFSFGETLKVLSPERIEQEARRRLRAALQRYEK